METSASFEARSAPSSYPTDRGVRQRAGAAAATATGEFQSVVLGSRIRLVAVSRGGEWSCRWLLRLRGRWGELVSAMENAPELPGDQAPHDKRGAKAADSDPGATDIAATSVNGGSAGSARRSPAGRAAGTSCRAGGRPAHASAAAAAGA